MKKAEEKTKKKPFDWTSHNRKIAKKRGESWKSRLKWAKLDPESPLIAWERVGKNLSQRDMTRLTSINTQPTYNRVEKRIKTIKKDHAMSISKALGIKLKDAFEKVDKYHYRAL